MIDPQTLVYCREAADFFRNRGKTNMENAIRTLLYSAESAVEAETTIAAADQAAEDKALAALLEPAAVGALGVRHPMVFALSQAISLRRQADAVQPLVLEERAG